jgi:COMPASS component SWD3
MVNESSQPKPGDAVLGGNNPPPIGAAVLGGIKGVKQRCANPDVKTRIGGLREAIKYGEPGIELLLHGLKDKVLEVGLLAYSLLQENVESELKKLLEIYAPQYQYVRALTHSANAHASISIAFSPNGQLLAGGAGYNNINLWDVEKGTIKTVLRGNPHIKVHSVAFSPNGQLLASAEEPQTINLWDVETGQLTATLKESSSSANSLVFSPNGELLASGGWSNRINLWDVERGMLTATFSGFSSYDGANFVAFSPNGQLLASGNDQKTIKLWDVETGQLTATLSGHSREVKSVAFSPNGQVVASGSYDQTVKLWNVETGTLIATLSGDSGINSVAFSPNGQLLASGGNQTINLWDIETGTLKTTLYGHSREVKSVAFSPNGQLLASASYDQTIKLWKAEISNLNLVDPVELFHSYLKIKQPQNSSVYEAIQIIINRGKQAEQIVAFSQLKNRKDPVVKTVLWLFINALKPQVAHNCKSLKYLLALNRWQEAKKESENILLVELGCREITTIHCDQESALITLQNISQVWQLHAINPSLLQEKESFDFFTQLNTKIQSIASYEPREPADHFSQRCYHETHE